MLPKSEWRSKINRLAAADDKNDADDATDVDDEKWERRADVLPTGKVVGIVQRNWKSVVAAFQPGWSDAKRKFVALQLCPSDEH